MTDNLKFLESFFPDNQALADIVVSSNVLPQLLRRREEEHILNLVDIEPSWIDEAVNSAIGSKSLDLVLSEKNISLSEFRTSLALPEALRRFSEYQFGPGLEEEFLSSQGSNDEVVYSVLRVRDSDLLQELWIRLEEKESTFSELARIYGEGPESKRNGMIGPLSMGNVFPRELSTLLRNLRPGEIHPPRKFGEWNLLLRLDNLSITPFDDNMRRLLLNKLLDSFLSSRVNTILSGSTPDSLHYQS